MLLEEFKNCLPSDITPHLDERKAVDLHQVAIWADHYALIQKSTFRRLPPTSGDNAGRESAAVDQKLPSGNVPPKLVNPKGSTAPPGSQPGLSTGPVCCKHHGHFKAECKALQRKHAKPMTVASPANIDPAIPKEYAPLVR